MAFDIKFDLHQLTVDASKKLQLSRCFSGWGSSRCSFSSRSSFSSRCSGWSWSRSSFGGDSAAVNYGAAATGATARNNFATTGFTSWSSFASWSATAASLSSAACLQASQQALRAAWWASWFANRSCFAASCWSWFANWSWFTYWSWFASGFASRSSTAALLSSHLGAKTCQKTWLAATTWIWFANWSWFANRCWLAYRSSFASWCTSISSSAATSVVQASEQAGSAASCSTAAASPTSFYITAVHRQTSKQHCGDDRHSTPKSSVHLSSNPQCRQ